MRPLLLFVLVGCDPDNQLAVAEPELVVEPATIDFGEIVVGDYGEIGAVVRNDALGTLKIDGAEFESGASADLQVLSWPEELEAGKEGLLVVHYTPDMEGEDFGTLNLSTNQPDKPVFPVSVTGMGVKPCIDIDPELLWFGTVAPGESSTKSFQVRAGCSGTLHIGNAAFPGGEAAAYSMKLPDGWETPYALRTGFSFTVEVTFAPPDTNEWVGAIWFESNDPDDSTSAVKLTGNTVDDPTENEPPVVEITTPNAGEYFLDNQLVTLTGAVYDADEAVTNLICAWYGDGTKLGDASGAVGIDGVVAGATLLPVGDVDVELRCFDSEGAKGSDSTTVKVWKHDEPLRYVISGGESEFDYFAIDDDIKFILNGTSFYDDNNDVYDNLAPISFEAMPGDTLQITAVDQNSCDAAVDPLILHWGTGKSQGLNDEICLSACPEHACYDGTYFGPWPSVIMDETYTISIP